MGSDFRHSLNRFGADGLNNYIKDPDLYEKKNDSPHDLSLSALYNAPILWFDGTEKNEVFR